MKNKFIHNPQSSHCKHTIKDEKVWALERGLPSQQDNTALKELLATFNDPEP